VRGIVAKCVNAEPGEIALTRSDDVPSVLGMTAAVEMQNAIGKKNVEDRVRFLSARLRAGLKQIRASRCGRRRIRGSPPA
jgi:selenocysteine lyase/cysteine desulfurase